MNVSMKICAAPIIGLLLLPGLAGAEGLKIGLVNMGRIISESPQAAEVGAALEEEFAPRQREIVAKKSEFDEKRVKFERDLEVMGPEERRNAEREVRKNERDLARINQEFNEDVNLRRNDALGKLQRQVLAQVQTFAAEKGYDLVISSESVLFASQAIDVTEEVLVGLKASFGKAPSAN